MTASDETAPVEPASAEEWKRLGSESYKCSNWKEAADLYSAALKYCSPGSGISVACLNNRAACWAQLKQHAAVITDTSEVLEHEPANLKALMRRMVALDALGKSEGALDDAGSVLTLDPKNAHAAQVVAKKRKSLTKKATDDLPTFAAGVPEQALTVFLFTENRPLQCYACLQSLKKHVKNARLSVHVFWHASGPPCIRSYQLLQSLPATSRIQYGSVTWVQVSNGQLFPAFSRTINRMSIKGQPQVLLLSDLVVFHTDVDVAAAIKVLEDRNEAFTARLDINPRVDYFPEASLLRSAPNLQNFAEDASIVLWTRWYDQTKQAYEAVPREMGWDAILDWTATIIRVSHVQHFFSALMPQPNNISELDERAADWLSRRQRMKRSEIKHRAACYDYPILVTLDPAEFGSCEAADQLFRAHLLAKHGLDGSGGPGKLAEFASQTGWKAQEVTDFFRGVTAKEGKDDLLLRGLFHPELYKDHYLSSVRAPAVPPSAGLPQCLNPPGPLVSWLVPARNAEAFVLDCLWSIEKQSGIGAGAFEVLLVDDGSEDGTAAVARAFAAAGRPHVRVVENGVQMGVAASLREGWARCRGDFVARLDADDEAEPDRLLKQLRFLEQHDTISVLGGRVRPFWTELRKCRMEKVVEKEGGRLSAIAWREFCGNQTSRQREQLTICQRGQEVIVVDASAEYQGCKLIRVGEVSMIQTPEKWKEALKSVQNLGDEVLLQRRDPLEPPKGSRYLDPTAVRAMSIFEDCISGTTATLRRAHFGSEEQGPFPLEEAEGHWCWLSLGPHQHAANLADSLVRARRHEGNRGQRDASGIHESSCAAVQHRLTKVCGVDVDMRDAAALLHFRGPSTSEQGDKLVEVLKEVERAFIAEHVRPQAEASRGDFWADFVSGREAALERAVVAPRKRFEELVLEVKRVITKPESPRDKHRSRTPPR